MVSEQEQLPLVLFRPTDCSLETMYQTRNQSTAYDGGQKLEIRDIPENQRHETVSKGESCFLIFNTALPFWPYSYDTTLHTEGATSAPDWSPDVQEIPERKLVARSRAHQWSHDLFPAPSGAARRVYSKNPLLQASFRAPPGPSASSTSRSFVVPGWIQECQDRPKLHSSWLNY